MENLILSSIVMACVTAIAIVFIVCFFKHLDSTGFAFKNKVAKDIQNLIETTDLLRFRNDSRIDELQGRARKLEQIINEIQESNHEQK